MHLLTSYPAFSGCQDLMGREGFPDELPPSILSIFTVSPHRILHRISRTASPALISCTASPALHLHKSPIAGPVYEDGKCVFHQPLTSRFSYAAADCIWPRGQNGESAGLNLSCIDSRFTAISA